MPTIRKATAAAVCILNIDIEYAGLLYVVVSCSEIFESKIGILEANTSLKHFGLVIDIVSGGPPNSLEPSHFLKHHSGVRGNERISAWSIAPSAEVPPKFSSVASLKLTLLSIIHADMLYYHPTII